MITNTIKVTDNALDALTPRFRHKANREEYAELLRQARGRWWEGSRSLEDWEYLELICAYLKSFDAAGYLDMVVDAMCDIQGDLLVQAFDSFLNGDGEQLRQLVTTRLQAAVDEDRQ